VTSYELNTATVTGGAYFDNYWDGDSNRVQMDYYNIIPDTTDTYQFVYGPTAGIPAVVEEVLPSEESAYYIREPGGELIARHNETDGWRYYHFDDLGSTRILTDADGEIADWYDYDAWGNVTDHEGDTLQPYQFVGQLGYYTHCQDSSIRFLQLGVRFYDPEIGRFTQRDPIRAGLTGYVYVEDKPSVLVDPTGLVFGWHICSNALRQRCEAICQTEYGTPCVGCFYKEKNGVVVRLICLCQWVPFSCRRSPGPWAPHAQDSARGDRRASGRAAYGNAAERGTATDLRLPPGVPW